MRWNSPELSEAVFAAKRRFERAGVASPFYDAKLIAASLLDVSSHLSLQFTAPHEIPDGFFSRYEEAVSRREKREPLQHILGTAPFGIHDLKVGPGVFIPRPETEVLAEWAVQAFEDYMDSLSEEEIDDPDFEAIVVDLGTGSGALAIYIAERAEPDVVIGVETSAVAREAAADNIVDRSEFGPYITIVDGDMTDPELLTEYSGKVAVVVANPPYVPFEPEESGTLSPEIYHDPPEAVFSGADGMDAIRGLIPVAARLLAPGGHLGIEHDDTTAGETRGLVEKHGAFENVRNLKDLTGRDRFVTASKIRGTNEKG